VTPGVQARIKNEQAIAALLEGASKILLTTHITPDGDGLGSALALLRFLRSKGKDARLINCSATPANLRFLIQRGEFSVWTPRRHRTFLQAADVIIATDIGGPHRLGRMEAPVRRAPGRRVVIDHHIYDNHFFHEALICTEASSSAEITCRLILSMGGRLVPELAEPLYVGLVSDTGNFCYTGTSPEAHRMAATLIEAGAAPHRIWRKLSCECSWKKMRVLGLCLASLREEVEGRVALTSVNLAFLERHEIPARDAFEVINHLLLIKGVEVGVFLMEISKTKTKVSLRSAGRVDVCAFAARHGGGGHRFAAGCTLEDKGLGEATNFCLGEIASLVREELDTEEPEDPEEPLP